MQTRPVTPRREPAQPGPRASRPGAPERRRPTQAADPAPPGRPTPRPGMFSLRSWRVRNRLTLLVLLPLLAAIGLGFARIDTLYQDRTHFSNAHFEAQTTGGVEEVLLALQQERLAVSVCLSVVQPCTVAAADRRAADIHNPPPNTDVKTVLEGYVTAYTDSQQATTSAITQISSVANQVIGNNAYSPDLRAAATEAFGRVTDLGMERQVATNSQVQSSVVFRAYTSTINDVIAAIGETSAGTSDALVNQDNSSLAAIDNLIEAQSIAQVYTQEVIADGQIGGAGPNPNVVEARIQESELNQAIASEASALNTFTGIAAPSLVQSYQATVSGPDITASQAATSRALAILQGNATWAASSTQLGPAVVDEALPATVGDLRTVQATNIQQLITDSQTLLTNADSSLYRNGALILIALLVSFLGIALVARSLVGPLQTLRAGAMDIAVNRLPEVVRRLRDADNFDAENAIEPIPINSNDEIGQVARAFDEVHQQAVRLASEQALLRSNVNSMFVNLSRRSQSLVQRQLRLIDELENSEQDPDQLANLFKLDHLATRMRRNGENLLVLAGEEPGRKWSQAVRLLDVMRAGASEVEQYERVALRDLPDVNVLGRVVNDLVHLVAELLENATSFSAPETKVSVTANMLNTGGVMLEIEDAGIGMTPEELDDANERLANPPVIDVAISRRMGLYVVGRLATRHGIQVRLRRSAGGGITALVLVPSTLLAGADGEQQAPTPELSATGARSLGALPRRGGGQVGFPDEPAATGPAFPAESSGAPPYRGSAPAGLGTGVGPAAAPANLSSSGLSNGDQFDDLPSFGAQVPGQPPAGRGPDDLPRRTEPLRDADAPGGPGRGPTPTIPGARAPFEDRPAGMGQEPPRSGLLDPNATTMFPTVGPGRPGAGPDSGAGRDAGAPPFQPFTPGRGESRSDRPDVRPPAGPGPFVPPFPGRREPSAEPAADSSPSRPQQPAPPGPLDTGQFPRIQDPASSGASQAGSGAPNAGQAPRTQEPASSGQFPRSQDPAPGGAPNAGQAPRIQDPASSGGQFPRTPSPEVAPPFPGPAVPQPGPAPAPRPAESAPTGQVPRIQDPASSGGQFPAARPGPGFPGPAAPAPFPPPIGARAPESDAAQLTPPPAKPAIPQGSGPSALDLPQVAQPAGQPSAVERLFAQNPLPPAPSTDERLPIFEAMESEWFRRRDEARAQAALSQSNTVLPPLPTMPRPAPPAPMSAGVGSGSGGSSGSTGGNSPSSGPPSNGISNGTGSASGKPSPSASSPVSSGPASTPTPSYPAPLRPANPPSSVPPQSAPPQSVPPQSTPPKSAPIPAPATASTPAPAGTPAEAPAQPNGSSPASAGIPVQPLAAASATSDSPAADSRGATPVENAGTWTSPGDEGWRAAQAAAKPVAAGLTQKGLPKRVPKSNLVPGSAGGTGAAKATPPIIPPRSADAVRGRLSSFHQGLRQGRDAAASTESEPGRGDGAGQDGKDG